MVKRMLFVLAAVVLAVLGFYYQSQNSKSAHQQAAAIVQMDQAGPISSESTAVPSLKDFVHAHMGASVTYTLQGSYDRAQAASQAAAAAQAANAQVYADAQRACGGKTDSLTQARCNEAYLQQHLGSTPSAAPVPAPKLSDYQVALHAPVWTPDLAGALLLGAAVSLGLGIYMLRSRR